ncbi:right-handed parallel beta-helix repeat-containing protein [Priestia endophytica]|uniref:right-handed parallel beta-helix repeat-containing protein n=1 Tax=Priestia endophytica TaxID=135735 RepID=UPI000DCA6642|nr:right-handed parallel beta-helix repeat-containing protein [Priestia endophytica]RAS82829.1 hypothetical protein A4U60_12220 [Priestia endophytica]
MFNRKTLTVSQKIFSKYKTIGEALKNAEHGAKILVEPGMYRESLIIDRNVEIIGKGSPQEVLIYSEKESPIIVQTELATIKGITIHQRGKYDNLNDYYAIEIPTGSIHIKDCIVRSDIGGGIRIYNKHTAPIINNCLIHDVQGIGIFVTEEATPIIIRGKIYANKENGLLIDKKASGIIEDCEIYHNDFANVWIGSEGDPLIKSCKIYSGRESGIWITERGRGIIDDCAIYGNTYSNVCIVHEGNPVVRKCHIYESSQNGIWVTEGGKGTLQDCEIYRNKYPNIGVTNSGNPMIMGCKIYDGESCGVWVSKKGEGSFSNSEIYNNRASNIDISHEGDPSIEGCTIYRSMQSGIWVSLKGYGTIENCKIYSNTYSNVGITHEGSPIIRASYIYDGAQNGIWIKEKGRGVIEKSYIYNNSFANVKIVTEGDPVIRSCHIYNGKESGVWVEEKGLGIIEGCHIYGHMYTNAGAAQGGNPIFKNCRIYEGKQHGVWVTESGLGIFMDCEIYRHRFSNVAIADKANPVIEGCHLYEAEQNGVWVKEGGLGFIENCRIHHNGYQNVKIMSEGNPLIRSCDIHHAKNWGIWATEKGSGTIENCHLYSNEKDNIIISEDSKTKIIGEKSELISLKFEKFLNELDNLIGMNNVKEQIKRMIHYIQKCGPDAKLKAEHTVLYGNPGTGKNTIARLLGNLYKTMGVLERGHIVKVSREELVGLSIDTTVEKTKKKINEAMGGILLIDEVSSFEHKKTRNNLGLEALQVLLREIKDKEGEFMVIMAGSEEEVKKFLFLNPRWNSLFSRHLHFQEYTPFELMEISERFLYKKGYTIDASAYNFLLSYYIQKYENRNPYFENATFARYIGEKAMKNVDCRLAKSLCEEHGPPSEKVVTFLDLQSVCREEE